MTGSRSEVAAIVLDPPAGVGNEAEHRVERDRVGAALHAAAGAREAAPAEASARAFEEAVGAHYVGLVRRLVAVLGDRAAAEDIAQETYLRAFRAWERFDGTDVRAWLYTIGLRLAFNERRRARRWLEAIRRVEAKRVPAPSDPDLWAALGGLDVRTRAALLLSAVDGYTQREIAAILGVPEGTVSSWLSRGKTSLREQLAEPSHRR